MPNHLSGILYSPDIKNILNTIKQPTIEQPTIEQPIDKENTQQTSNQECESCRIRRFNNKWYSGTQQLFCSKILCFPIAIISSIPIAFFNMSGLPQFMCGMNGCTLLQGKYTTDPNVCYICYGIYE